MKRAVILGILVVGQVQAAQWSNWRGEEGGGVASDSPAKVSENSKPVWQADLPGRGCSTPIVWDDRIVVTCEIDGQDGVLVYDLEGKELWRHRFGKVAGTRHKNAGSGCNPSALTDGEHVYVYYKSGTLAALTMKGQEVWTRNLHDEYSPDGLKWDLGTSPIFAGGRIVVALMHNRNPSFLISFDKKTGKEVWKSPRDYKAPEEAQDAYTTPFVTTVDGVETIVTWGCDHLSGHDAKTGRELWVHGDFNPKQRGNWRVIASAAETGGVAIVPFGRGDFVAGVKLGGSGDTTKKNRLWTVNGVGSDSCTPAARDGKFYVLNDKGRNRGRVTCLDAKTGRKEWETMLPRSAAIYYSSPLIAGNRFYAGRSDGTLFCGTITARGLADVAEKELNDTLVASPISIDSKLIVRTHGKLWCFE